MKYRRLVSDIGAIVLTVTFFSCGTRQITDLSKEGIIPKPVSVISSGKSFELKKGTDIYYQGESEELKQTGQYLSENLEPIAGFRFEVKPADKLPGSKAIYLSLENSDSLSGNEGYKLTILKNRILLTAGKPEGVFRGVQTILQLLPPGVDLAENQAITLKIAGNYPLKLK
jgi:hexosaminidase